VAFYLDTSAAVKLVVAESGSAALRRWVGDRSGRLVSSDLLRTELVRALRRIDPALVHAAPRVLGGIILIGLDARIFDVAAGLAPPELRSLDAVHLAAAIELGDDLDGLVTYDDRLATAARGLGVTVVQPR